MYKIKIGDLISIRHYSGVKPFKSMVLNVNNEIVNIKLTRDFAVMSFFEDDPIVFGYEYEERVYIFGGHILSINPKEGTAELKIDSVDAAAEQRKYERYPVSLYADLRHREYRKKFLATIKDLSYYGMMIYTKANLEIYDELEIDIYMDKTILFLKTNVVRKAEGPGCFEYGLSVVYEDTNSLNYMKDYIKRLREEQEDAIRKLKLSK